MWHFIIKTIDGKKHYLASGTGRWIKTKPTAAMFPTKEAAMQRAKEVGGWIQAK